MTSTALSHPSDDCRSFFRLTMSQVRHPSFPVTFDRDLAVSALRSLPEDLRLDPPMPANLLCNTGCMVCRLGGAWCDPTKVFFDEVTTFDRINNQWTPIVRSEDWFFTARAAQYGAKVMATTSLKVRHYGISAFSNDQLWGMPIDVENLAQWGVAPESLGAKRR